MNIIELLQQELQQEGETTRKFLALAPLDKGDWAPHPKSMKLLELVTHIADLASWPRLGLTTSELDFAASPYDPPKPQSNGELVAMHDKGLAESLAHLSKATEADLQLPWVLRNGDVIYAEMTKIGLIRVSISQIIHHRAQLGVYLRLLDIPLPGSYGPSVDEQGF